MTFCMKNMIIILKSFYINLFRENKDKTQSQCKKILKVNGTLSILNVKCNVNVTTNKASIIIIKLSPNASYRAI